VKNELTSDFKNTTRVTETLNAKKLSKALQMQKDEMNVEFERRE
jgi:hypothetical protein